MEIKIKETGKTEELSIIDPESGVNWINDLMGNHDALPEINEETGNYIMDQESFDWWLDLTDRLQEAEDMVHEKKSELEGEEYDDFIAEIENIACDLEDLPENLISVCDNS